MAVGAGGGNCRSTGAPRLMAHGASGDGAREWTLIFLWPLTIRGKERDPDTESCRAQALQASSDTGRDAGLTPEVEWPYDVVKPL